MSGIINRMIGKSAVQFIQRFISRLDPEDVDVYVNEKFDLLGSILNGNWGDEERLRKTIAGNLHRAKDHIKKWSVDDFLENYLKKKNPELYNYFRTDNNGGLTWLNWTREELLKAASN